LLLFAAPAREAGREGLSLRLIDVSRGAGVETFRQQAAGTERELVFDAPPPGSGPLRVEYAAPAGFSARLEGAGVVFSSERSARRLRLSEAFWADASGARWPLAASVEGPRVRYTVSAELLAATRWPAKLDPLVTAEVEVQPFVTGAQPMLLTGTRPLVALDWSSDHFLTVVPMAPTLATQRMSAALGALDPIPNTTNAGVVATSWVDVVHLGASDLAVFADTYSRGLQGLRFDAQGLPLDATPHVYPDAGIILAAPAVGTDGTQALAVWSDFSQTWAARIAPSGQTLDPNGILISSENDLDLAVAGGDAGFLVAARLASGGVGIYRLSSSGTVMGPASIVQPGAGVARPALAWNGQEYLIAYFTGFSPGPAAVRATRLSAFGAVLDAPALLLDADAGLENGVRDPEIAVAALGTDFMVAWTRKLAAGGAQAEARAVTATGTLGPLAAPLALNTPDSLKLVATDVGLLLAWQDEVPVPTRLYATIEGTRLNAAGQALDLPPARIFTGPDSQSEAVVALTSGVQLAAWIDRRDFAQEIYARRLSPGGTALDPTETQITSNAGVIDIVSAAATGDTVTLVTLERGADAGGTIWTHVLSPAATELARHPLAAAVCCSTIGGDDAGSVVGWSDMTNVAYAMRLDTQGQPIAAPQVLGLATYSARAASYGNGDLVVWGDTSGEVLGRRLDRSGALLGGALTIDTRYSACPMPAAGPGLVLVCWLVGLMVDEIDCARFDSTGTRLDATPLVIGTSTGCPGPFWFGDSFEVTFPATDGGALIRPVFRDGGLGPVDVSTFLFDTTVSESQPGIGMVGSQSKTALPGATHATVLILGAQGDGAPCADAGECVSGICEQVCCVAPGQCTAAADGGTPDGGVATPDGGVRVPDGGVLLPDGGVLLADGGVLEPDGGVLRPDGGIVPPSPLALDVSCGCGSTGGGSAWFGLALALGLRRRRQG
jgi:hypothetical protein